MHYRNTSNSIDTKKSIQNIPKKTLSEKVKKGGIVQNSFSKNFFNKFNEI